MAGAAFQYITRSIPSVDITLLSPAVTIMVFTLPPSTEVKPLARGPRRVPSDR